ncbi:hypothetical protein ACLKA7_011711 [Drosophila subpalustris]
MSNPFSNKDQVISPSCNKDILSSPGRNQDQVTNPRSSQGTATGLVLVQRKTLRSQDSFRSQDSILADAGFDPDVLAVAITSTHTYTIAHHHPSGRAKQAHGERVRGSGAAATVPVKDPYQKDS